MIQQSTQSTWSTWATEKNIASLSRGALAGCIGTIPMTLFMLTMHRLLPKWQQYALPPERITDEMADRADVKKYMGKPLRVGVALVSHFGYGTAMGVIYSITVRLLPLPAVAKGILWGLVVWGGSYLGLLPALDFSASADKEPPKRIWLMIVAHILWGASVGVLDR